MDKYDLVIVGAGPGGLSASIYAKHRQIHTLTLEANEIGGQLTKVYPHKPITDFPSYISITGQELIDKIEQQINTLGINLIPQISVDRIVTKDKLFIIEAGVHQYQARSVLLATGMGHYQPRKLNIPGEDKYNQKGVFYQMPPENIVGKKVLIIGGGDTAFETALMVLEKGGFPIVIHRSQNFRAQEATFTKVKQMQIPLKVDCQITQIIGDDRMQSLEIKKLDGTIEKLDADALIICIGMDLETNFLNSVGVKHENGAVWTDSSMGTSIPGIYACGDITVPLGKMKRITISLGSAAIAINSIAQYLKSIRT